MERAGEGVREFPSSTQSRQHPFKPYHRLERQTKHQSMIKATHIHTYICTYIYFSEGMFTYFFTPKKVWKRWQLNDFLKVPTKEQKSALLGTFCIILTTPDCRPTSGFATDPSKFLSWLPINSQSTRSWDSIYRFFAAGGHPLIGNIHIEKCHKTWIGNSTTGCKWQKCQAFSSRP